MHSLHDVPQATNNFDTEQIKDLILLFYHKFKGGKHTFFSLSLSDAPSPILMMGFRSRQQYLTNGVIYVHFKALLPISYSTFGTLYIYIYEHIYIYILEFELCIYPISLIHRMVKIMTLMNKNINMSQSKATIIFPNNKLVAAQTRTFTNFRFKRITNIAAPFLCSVVEFIYVAFL